MYVGSGLLVTELEHAAPHKQKIKKLYIIRQLWVCSGLQWSATDVAHEHCDCGSGSREAGINSVASKKCSLRSLQIKGDSKSAPGF